MGEAEVSKPFITDISDSVQGYINLYLMSTGCTAIGALTVVANIINFIVLLKQGCKDCVSLCLLSLTFSDLFTGVFMAAYSVCYAIASTGVMYHVDPFSIMYLVSWVRGMCFDLSMLTTAFISVERCLSVLVPLQFKNLVTFKRAAIVLFALYAFTFGVYSIPYATCGLSPQWDPRTNTTRILLWVAENRSQIEFYVTTLFHIVNGTVCEIVVTVSTYGMIRGLRRSNRFRQTNATESKSDNMSKKNATIVKMILILAAIFVLCNLVRLFVIYFRRIVPDITYGKRLHNIYNTLIGILFFFGTLNALVNIFVYYCLKPSYKAIFLRMFCGRSDDKKSPQTLPSRDQGTNTKPQPTENFELPEGKLVLDVRNVDGKTK